MPPETHGLESRPIRVLQIGSPSGLFGAERWILALIKHLAAPQVQTVVGVIQDDAGDKEPPLCGLAADLGFETMVVKAPGKVSRAAVTQLRAEIRSRGIDIVHTHFYKPTLVASLAIHQTDCALVSTPHGWSSNAGIKLMVYQWLERIAFSRADAVAPLSSDLEVGLRRLPWLDSKKIRLISNGVDLSEVNASRSVSQIVEQVRQSGAFVVGYIGQLIARKRVDTLIEAFAATANLERHLFIIGDGDQRERLESLAAELKVANRTHFLGFRDDRLAFLRGFDVLVLPSELEGIPRCLMESMAAGVPVVGSEIPGITDLIAHEKTGLLFPLGNSAALASALQRLDQDRALGSSLADRGMSLVRESFSAEAMAAAYLRLYRDVVASRTGAVTAESAAGVSVR
jgi:glycosyltransferase involved in cell wall biosynthesis